MKSLPRRSWIESVIIQPSGIPSAFIIVDSFAGANITTTISPDGEVYGRSYEWDPAALLDHL